MSLLAERPDVRQDMNNVRLALKAKVRGNYSAPVEVVLSDGETLMVDIVPLYYISAAVRKAVSGIEARPKLALMKAPGSISLPVFKILLSYANGNANSCNWASDLDQRPDLAGDVWEAAVVYKVDGLEKLVRDVAFDADMGALNERTAVRLLTTQFDALPESYRATVFRYICHNYSEISTSPNWNVLPYSTMRALLISQQLRATQRDKFDAIQVWYLSPPEPRVDRGQEFYRLAKRIHYPLCGPGDEDVAVYNDVSRYAGWGALAPVPALVRKRRGNTVFKAFPLDTLLERVRMAQQMHLFHVNPRFVGQFEAFNYYWQLEVPCYGTYKVTKAPQIGAYLRVLHGTSEAGTSLAGSFGGSTLVGSLKTRFQLKIYTDDDFDKRPYRETECFEVDMFNLPRGSKMHGYPALLGKKSVERFLARPPSPQCPSFYIAVEIMRVKELAPASRHDRHMDPIKH
jgi:hypothetical protein